MEELDTSIKSVDPSRITFPSPCKRRDYCWRGEKSRRWGDENHLDENARSFRNQQVGEEERLSKINRRTTFW